MKLLITHTHILYIYIGPITYLLWFIITWQQKDISILQYTYFIYLFYKTQWNPIRTSYKKWLRTNIPSLNFKRATEVIHRLLLWTCWLLCRWIFTSTVFSKSTLCFFNCLNIILYTDSIVLSILLCNCICSNITILIDNRTC